MRGTVADFPLLDLPRVGVDCSQGKGEDDFSLLSRWGKVALHHEHSNTMNAQVIGQRIRRECERLAALVTSLRQPQSAPVDPHTIPVRIDDDGTGNALVAFLGAEGYSVVGVGAACASSDDTKYPRRRDELWFQCAAKAEAGLVWLGGLGQDTRRRLRQQLLAVAWELDQRGRRCVERKDITKEKIGRSPDFADALNLAFIEDAALGITAIEPGPVPKSEKRWGWK